MNTESNKQKWIKMVNDTLTMGGKSKITINKYTYAIERFLNAHGNNTKSTIEIHLKNPLEKDLTLEKGNKNV